MKNKINNLVKISLFLLLFCGIVFTGCEKDDYSPQSIKSVVNKYDLKEVSPGQTNIIASFDNAEEASKFLENFSLLKIRNHKEIGRLKSGNPENDIDDSETEETEETEFDAIYHEPSGTLICIAKGVGGTLPYMNFTVKIDVSNMNNPNVTSAEVTGVTYGFSYDLNNQNASFSNNGDSINFGVSGSTDWGVQIGGTTYGASQNINISGSYNFNNNTCTMSNDQQFGW